MKKYLPGDVVEFPFVITHRCGGCRKWHNWRFDKAGSRIPLSLRCACGYVVELIELVGDTEQENHLLRSYTE